ncbi:ES1 protein, mitochondrial [Polyodon spathula]|uniref:ES1 protein, mitochondrial n=1 Tax=Polyodon spathula TaxID=7913 RepID=UPI001B7D948B|nr:ES1 protein, mitochondrial [Polyodon spathula]
MLASRALLVKQVAAVLTKQPVCLTHHSGDWGNWGNTSISVVFSGCGWWDGTDIHEAAYTVYHLSRNGARFQLFAPNQQQMHVVDHVKGQPASGENSPATLCRRKKVSGEHGKGETDTKSDTTQSHIVSPVYGQITKQVVKRGTKVYTHIPHGSTVQDLSKLDVSSFDAVIFPGGYGVTKNLSTFSSDGKECKINPDVERIMKEFHCSRKPIGLSCMAPILACRVLPSLEVTMGQERDESSRWGRWPYTSMVQAVKSMGARHSTREPYEAHVDEKNKVVSTPTFMWETDYHYHYIFDGIGSMVKHVMRMTTAK